jgi:hypothetical protein
MKSGVYLSAGCPDHRLALGQGDRLKSTKQAECSKSISEAGIEFS